LSSSKSFFSFQLTEMAGAMECQICFEEMTERLQLPQTKTNNGDVLRAADCGHEICCSCMAKHVAVKVEEQRVFCMRCPMVGCKNDLFEKDLRNLVTKGALETTIVDRFVELRARDFTARAQNLSDVVPGRQEDYDRVRRLWETTRLCPKCNVAIEKSQGCNSFWCICGHHFDYAKAPRAVGQGMKNFSYIITMAELLCMGLDEAERVGEWKLYFKARRLQEGLAVPLDEAVNICKRASKGDADARAAIRRLREVEVVVGEVEESEDPLMDACDS